MAHKTTKTFALPFRAIQQLFTMINNDEEEHGQQYKKKDIKAGSTRQNWTCLTAFSLWHTIGLKCHQIQMITAVISHSWHLPHKKLSENTTKPNFHIHDTVNTKWSLTKFSKDLVSSEMLYFWNNQKYDPPTITSGCHFGVVWTRWWRHHLAGKAHAYLLSLEQLPLLLRGRSKCTPISPCCDSKTLARMCCGKSYDSDHFKASNHQTSQKIRR